MAEEDNSFKNLGVIDQLAESCHNLGWKTPTQIQTETIPAALAGKDIIALAQTGSGKTGAFAIPILQSLLESPQPFFACVVAPTRELSIQIADQFRALGSAIGGARCAVLVGGVDRVQQSIALAKRPHIIVATPGRLLDHLSNTKGFSLRTLKYFVLDEADRLLDENFEKEINEILEIIPRDRRTYLFSATMTKKVKKIQKACLKNPVKIEIGSKYSIVDTLIQRICFMPDEVRHIKGIFLVYVLRKMSEQRSCMVFTRTCNETIILACMLQNAGFKGAIPINGHMPEWKRLEALGEFKLGGESNILVCTDVASRGLDIPLVDMVVNYNMPLNAKDYIHRVGRTALAGRTGVAISLVNQYEIAWLYEIEGHIGMKIPLDPCGWHEVVRRYSEVVCEAMRISVRQIKELGMVKKRRRGDRREDGDDDDDGEEDVMMKYLGLNKGKSFKKLARR